MPMKTQISFLILTFVIALSGLGVYCLANNDSKEAAPMEKTSLIVATDLHYLAPSLTDNGAYFQNLIHHSDGKVMDCIEPLTDAFLDEVIAAAPEALILSGDITYNGARLSHEALAEKLQAVEDAGIPVLVIPGNHDLENSNAARFVGDSFQRVASVTAAEFAEIYADFGFSDALSRDTDSLSYVYAVSDSLWVLMLDVNTADAANAVKESTLVWIETQLQAAARAGAQVVAVSHQNILAHNSIFINGYLIRNSDELLALYETYGVLANFSGHLHCQHISQSENGLYDIATSSLAVYPNQYGVVTVRDGGGTYDTKTVDVAAWAKKKSPENSELLDFASYSYSFFLEGGYDQGLEAAGDRADAPALAEFFAQVNQAFFAGRMDTVDLNSAYFDLWQSVDGFLPLYLDSTRDDGAVNFNHLDF
jgi:3',5'-cyclic AMP phosphodiesterase CpdA